jgi:hypothetical protein
MTDLSRLREIPLEEVLALSNGVKDKHDTKRWHTTIGRISIEGQKFFNWSLGTGGGGAIDLAKQLQNSDFKTAKDWLINNFFREPLTATKPKKNKAPTKNESRIACVKDYLIRQRKLPEEIIKTLIHTGQVYADNYNNTVFLLLGKEKITTGAELCGTSNLPWKGLYKGSKRHEGFFYTGDPSASNCILCESAVDAISCEAIYPGQLFISTSGVLSKPKYLKALLKRYETVYCGFDNDDAGEKSATIMISTYPVVRGLRPIRKDWNSQIIEK